MNPWSQSKLIPPGTAPAPPPARSPFSGYTSASPGNYPEDKHLGLYIHSCPRCHAPFSGHKRRAQCKTCLNTPRPKRAALLKDPPTRRAKTKVLPQQPNTRPCAARIITGAAFADCPNPSIPGYPFCPAHRIATP